MAECLTCGKPLSMDEEGLCLKMLGPFTEQFYCLSCLAEKMRVPESTLEKIIINFRKNGCTLFTPWNG